VDHKLLDAPQRRPVTAHNAHISDVVLAPDVLSPFFDDAQAQYRLSLASARSGARRPHFPRSFALLVGWSDGSVHHVTRLEFCKNIRHDGGHARREFEEVIVPRFGRMYENRSRGYWCDARTLLRVHRDAEKEGLVILGSIHLHPDWHRIGPEEERWMRMSERPTPTDEYLFRNTGWPVNVICYVEGDGGRLAYTLAAWAPPDRDDPAAVCRELEIAAAARTILIEGDGAAAR
jgi:hypothetical protein